jgi:hypothetical protein
VPGLEAPPPAPVDDPVVPPSVVGLPEVPPVPEASAPAGPLVQAQPGPLPGVGTVRGVGLPATLAALAVVGVASLLVRVLLAEPAARRGPLGAAAA